MEVKRTCGMQPDEGHAAELLELGDPFLELDREWRVVRVNARQEALSRRPRSETVGRTVAELWPELATPDSRIRQELSRCIEERVPVQFEDFYAPLDMWISVTAYPVTGGGIAVFFRDVSDPKRAEDQVRQLASIVQNTDDAIISKNVRGVILTWNAGAERLFGWRADEMIGEPIARLLPPDRVEEEDRILAAVRAGEAVQHYETTRLRKDGAVVEVSVTVSPLRDDEGRIVGASKIARDITERKLAERRMRESEEALRASKEQLRAALERLRAEVESTPLALVEWDSQFRVAAYSRRAEELFGWRAEEVVGKRIDEIPWIPEEDWPSVRAVMHDMSSGVRPTNVNANRNLTKDGRVIACEWYNSTTHDEAGRLVSVLSLVLDVTARERAEASLRESEARLRLALDAAKFGTFVLDIPTKRLTWDTPKVRMWGIEEGQELKYPDVLERMPAEDAARVAAAVEAAMKTGEYDAEYRVIWPDRSVHWLYARGRVEFEHGKPVRLLGVELDITDRKRAEQKVHENDARLRAVFGSLVEGVVFLNVRGEVEQVNEAVETRHGLAFDELTDPVRDPRSRIIRSDGTTLPEDEQPAIVALRTGKPVNDVEMGVPARDGWIRWLLVNAQPVRDERGAVLGAVASFFDITDRKQAEEALRDSEERLRAALEGGHLGTWDLDLLTNAAVRSPRHDEIWGFKEPQPTWTLEMAMSRVVPEDRPVIEAAYERGFKSGFVSHENRIKWDDGSIHWIAASGRVRYDDAGRPVRVTGVVADITDRKRAEDGLRELNEQLREADRRKDEFLGMLSHELRNPLAPIRNSLYILDRAEPNGQQARRAKEIANRQLGHLARLVDDLLDVTRIARGKIELRRAELDVAALARRTAEDHRQLMLDRHVDLGLELPEAPVLVEGDETRLAQVLGNLLHNAAKFTPAGGRVTLTVAAQGANAEIRVRDTGAGIEPGMMKAIFEPFTQAKQTLARSEGGLGLGLALVKGLVALHGGEVTGSSEGPGRGTEFLVSLPLASGGRDHLTTTGTAPKRSPVERMRVLVVDDNRDAADSLAQLVTMLGHDPEVAYDPYDGLAKAAESIPDVVFCDIGLPGMDGYEFARQLRALAVDRRVRLVAVSGYAQPEDVSRAIEAGFDAHVAKPPDPAALAGMLA